MTPAHLPTSAITAFSTVVVGAIGVIMIVVGGRAILSGAMTLGDFIWYIFLTGLMAAPVVQIASIGTQISEAFAGLDRIRELMAMSTEDEEDSDESRGPKVALVGRPNVGKSTLINAWLGEERVIAFDMPGTTRDAIEVPFEREGRAYTLIDTAGLRRKGKVFEAVEKPALKPLVGERFDPPRWDKVKVHPDHHIRFGYALYSVPEIYRRKEVEVRGDNRIVRIYYAGEVK